MTTQPIDHAHGDPNTPEQIVAALPEEERTRFLSEYRTALEAAHEVWRFQQLQEVLTRWGLKATAYSRPGYTQRRQEAREATTPGVSLEELDARRAATR